MSVLISICSFKSIFHGINHVVVHRSEGLLPNSVLFYMYRTGLREDWLPVYMDRSNYSYVCLLCGMPLKF